MIFKTDDINIFQQMIVKAIHDGLKFNSFVDAYNNYVIEYTGGY